MKNILIAIVIALISLSSFAARLSMSDLQIMVNESVVDHFSTTLINKSQPIEWEDIINHELLASKKENAVLVKTTVTVHTYGQDDPSLDLANDYNCVCEVTDNGSDWVVTKTECKLAE